MSHKQDKIVVVEGLYKSFKLPHEKHNGVKQALVNMFQGKNGSENQKVLSNVSLDINRGEFFGIVGRNGSGKSTLLKLLAGIYSPNKGRVQVNGSLTPFIELGVGFNPELTGRENVFLNGALLGFDRAEMSEMYDEIVEFAELEKFMDQKLKNYSSGMQVRLAFSIAIRAESDVLLIDEVLAVGDASFQQKCYEMFKKIQDQGRTVILVTHDMSAVLRFCDRAMLLHNGSVATIGKPSEVADKYLELNYDQDTKAGVKNNQSDTGILIKCLGIFDDGGDLKSLNTLQKAIIKLQIKNRSDNEEIHLGLQIFNDADNYCFGTNTLISGLTAINKKEFIVEFNIEQTFTPGRYYVNVAALTKSAEKVISYNPKIYSFSVKQDTKFEGVALMNHKWSIKDV